MGEGKSYFVKIDSRGKILDCDNCFRKRYNIILNEEEYFLQNIMKFDVQEGFEKVLERCFETQVLSLPFSITAKGDSEKVVWEIFTHYSAGGNKIINCFGSNTNYTVPVENQAELACVLHSLFDNTHHFQIFIHSDFSLAFYNKRAFQLMKMLYDIELQAGDNVAEILEQLEEDIKIYFKESFLEALKGKQIVREQKLQKDIELWYQQIYYPVYSEEKLLGVAVIIIDITEQKIFENKIKEQNKRLRQIAYHQCHSVRKPLANIKGLISLLDEKEMNDEQKEIIRQLTQSSEELDSIIHETVFATKQTEDYF